MPPLVTPQALGDALIPKVTANPTDTYSGAPRSSQLDQLADSLSSLVPSLSRFSAQRQEKERLDAQMAGEQLAANLANNREQWSAATRDGKIAPGRSPWVRFYAAQKMGETLGKQYAEALALKTARLPEASTLQQWEDARAAVEREFLTANAGAFSGNAHFMSGFRRTADVVVDRERTGWVELEAKRTERDALTGYANGLTAAYKDGAGRVAEPELVARMNAQRVQAMASGVPEAQLDKLAVDTLAALALEMKDASLVQRLAKSMTGAGGGALDRTAAYSARDFGGLAEQITLRRIAYDEQMEKQRDERERDTITAALDAVLAEGRQSGAPNWTATRGRLKAAGVRNVETALADIRERYLQANDGEFVTLSDAFWKRRDPDQLMKQARGAFEQGRLSAQHYSSLRALAEAERDQRAALAREAARLTDRGQQPLAYTMEQVYQLEPMRVVDEVVKEMMSTSYGKGRPVFISEKDARLVVIGVRRRLGAMIAASGARPELFQTYMDNVLPLVREETFSVKGVRPPWEWQPTSLPKTRNAPPASAEGSQQGSRGQISTPMRVVQEPDATAQPNKRPDWSRVEIESLQKRWAGAVLERERRNGLTSQEAQLLDPYMGLTLRDVEILKAIGATTSGNTPLALANALRNARY